MVYFDYLDCWIMEYFEINYKYLPAKKYKKSFEKITFLNNASNIGMYVLRDIFISIDDLTAQIDFVVITAQRVYFIECKNLIGNITVNSSGEFKRDYYLGNKHVVEGMYSPYRQSIRHKDIFKKIWMSRHKRITTFLLSKTFDDLYRPLVVLANSKSLLDIRYAPKEIKSNIVRVDGLIDFIKKDGTSRSKDNYLSQKDMLALAKSFLELHQDVSHDYSIKYGAVEKDTLSLENKLRNFRKQKSVQMKVPAYYVFTDEEMNKIIELCPKTLDILQNSKILSPVKLKCHGEEIISIFKSEDV